ncbi:MAG TPA: hypothetical protein VFX58_06755 [Chitinophagaceae bacterium]|nr:hypothetical protein [Chitinophagaceae bacterium]
MRVIMLLFLILAVYRAGGQELYVYSEPASNMPAKSISTKLSAMYGRGVHSNRILQRYTPEIMFGINKNWMVHASAGFSDMHQPGFIFESARLYAKWRFWSVDELHKHFRMAAFGAATYSRNHLDHNEINLAGGEQGGLQAGLIATQLWDKLAVSGTVAINEVLAEERREKISPDPYAFRSINYSVSAGYLLLPGNYTDYRQTNLNLYLELLGGRNLDWPAEKYYVDLAPSVQLIFNSTSKLNLGYRFELKSDIYRLMRNSVMISYEYIFLNALKKRKR